MPPKRAPKRAPKQKKNECDFLLKDPGVLKCNYKYDCEKTQGSGEHGKKSKECLRYATHRPLGSTSQYCFRHAEKFMQCEKPDAWEEHKLKLKTDLDINLDEFGEPDAGLEEYKDKVKSDLKIKYDKLYTAR